LSPRQGPRFGKTSVAWRGAGAILPIKPFPPFEELSAVDFRPFFSGSWFARTAKNLAERKESL
jgi:hypothetical protein